MDLADVVEQSAVRSLPGKESAGVPRLSMSSTTIQMSRR